jgi:hypothetical protein
MYKTLSCMGAIRLVVVGFLALHLAAGCTDKSAEKNKMAAKKTSNTVVPVRVVRTANGYELQRGGKPYFIKGAGGLEHFSQVRAAGGNSVRLWTADYAQPLLDSAQAQNLTVLLGLWMIPERDGFDYYDKKAIDKQLLALRKEVIRYRNHPALLAWDVGNEMDVSALNLEVYTAINQVAQMIHQLDPNHPVVTTIAERKILPEVRKRCPDLDFVALNSYANLLDMPQYLRSINWQQPYIITEFGTRGYWESPLTKWRAPLEQSSTNKAKFTAERYQAGIESQRGQCLGSYVFYWGNRQEATPTWFSLFTPGGERTAVVDEMQYLWTGTRPDNPAPQAGFVRIDGKYDSNDITLLPAHEYPAVVTATSPNKDALRIQWEVMPESRWQEDPKTLHAREEAVAGSIVQQGQKRTTLLTPTKPGAYRLYVTITNEHGRAATANCPFYVE